MPRDNPASFLERFEAGEIPAAEFSHREHVRLAWSVFELHPPLVAIERFSCALRGFAESNGKPDLYHETITWAYLLLIRERRDELPPGHDWPAFEAANPDLFAWAPGVLDRYYRSETLSSSRARACFVLPDAGLAVSGVGSPSKGGFP